ncbi:lantibiotic dehydratase [Streptacidiphilus neutrinimicus]|uniref:lantibiotic dehydratase n=1 Tax=Streptacidiphilus neutrinimicus TaxID=105420 RepID=UPI0009FCDC91|nr:lantibiotic dehydratase [Streptacidiphilus neutrinimicus]
MKATQIPSFRAGTVALVRAATNLPVPDQEWPDLGDTSTAGAASQVAWLRALMDTPRLREAMEQASADLTAALFEICVSPAPRPRDVRRAAESAAKYLLRAQHRPTPFGWFAGVAVARFEQSACAEWGDTHARISPSSAWLNTITQRLEGAEELLLDLPVVANSTLTICGDHLVVPYQLSDSGTGRAAETRLRLSRPVRLVVDAARHPVTVGELAGKLRADFPAVGGVATQRLLRQLINYRVLITALHAPSTVTDPLGHLLARLDALGAGATESAADFIKELHEVQEELKARNAQTGEPTRRGPLADRMRALAPDQVEHPLAVDVRLGADLVLPALVGREAEKAAMALAQLSTAPYGSPEMKEYHHLFYERYGIGTLVPILDVVADSGIGLPDGYLGTVSDARRPRVSERDDVLVELAQCAALDGSDEILVDDHLVRRLRRGNDPFRLPPHLELIAQVHASSIENLQRGHFSLAVVSVSRGVGVTVGRFLPVLDEQDRRAFEAELRELPASDASTVPVQLSFPPLLPGNAHIARSPQVLPLLLTLDEHRAGGEQTLSLADVTVGCDGRRLYLAVPKWGKRIEVVAMNALTLRTHTPPLARLLIELSRAVATQVTVFDWGAARRMPFLPRLRYGRTVLAPARWRLNTCELPAAQGDLACWEAGFAEWRARRRLPDRVHLTYGDQFLALDLNHPGHRHLLRSQLGRTATVLLTEAPQGFGWCQGRPHEIVIPLKADAAPPWPRLPVPTRARLASVDQIQSPGASRTLLAALYGDQRRQNVILSDHLSDLLGRLDEAPWWYIRYRDPDHHLRLRIALSDHWDFPQAARAVSAWADELRTAGLLKDLRFLSSYAEHGRWGSGTAYAAVEEVFRADSRALLAQLRQRRRPDQRALVAAHTLAIVAGYLGSTEAGTQWLINHLPAAPEQVPRPQYTSAVRLADPSHDWQALRTVAGGDAIVDAWRDRDSALSAYRRHLPGPDTQGVDVNDVLASLLHTHFVRHIGVDFKEEAVCRYLARAAAKAWTAKAKGASS